MSNEIDLPAIAASVARALGLEPLPPADGVSLSHHATKPDAPWAYLCLLGSNLTGPYWRCACLDWLNEEGWEVRIVTADAKMPHSAEGDTLRMVYVTCPAALAPAALVHEVVKARG